MRHLLREATRKINSHLWHPAKWIWMMSRRQKDGLYGGPKFSHDVSGRRMKCIVISRFQYNIKDYRNNLNGSSAFHLNSIQEHFRIANRTKLLAVLCAGGFESWARAAVQLKG